MRPLRRCNQSLWHHPQSARKEQASTKLPSVWMLQTRMLTALSSAAFRCSGSNWGKGPLCTKFWCKSVSLSETETFLVFPFKLKKRKEKNNFPNNCFCNSNTSALGEVLKYKWGVMKITNPIRAKQAMSMSHCLNQKPHFLFTCFSIKAHVNEYSNKLLAHMSH